MFWFRCVRDRHRSCKLNIVEKSTCHMMATAVPFNLIQTTIDNLVSRLLALSHKMTPPSFAWFGWDERSELAWKISEVATFNIVRALQNDPEYKWTLRILCTAALMSLYKFGSVEVEDGDRGFTSMCIEEHDQIKKDCIIFPCTLSYSRREGGRIYLYFFLGYYHW